MKRPIVARSGLSPRNAVFAFAVHARELGRKLRGFEERIWSLLGSRTIEDLIDLPLTEDAASLATVEVLNKLRAPASTIRGGGISVPGWTGKIDANEGRAGQAWETCTRFRD